MFTAFSGLSLEYFYFTIFRVDLAERNTYLIFSLSFVVQNRGKFNDGFRTYCKKNKGKRNTCQQKVLVNKKFSHDAGSKVVVNRHKLKSREKHN